MIAKKRGRKSLQKENMTEKLADMSDQCTNIPQEKRK